MTRAAVYLRISQDPTGEQAGVTRQREDCLELVEQQKWEIAEVYQDNDISASSGKPRPGYLKMLTDIRAGHIDAVVAWHPDRLYRKLRDLEGLIDAVEQNNVVMRTVRAGEIDLSTPTGRMLARILSATAQAEGEVKADRWKRSWRQAREAGKPVTTGSRMFCYTATGELIPEEAAISRQMADKLLAGEGLLEVARWLQEQGILTTRGNVWASNTVKRHLLSPRIAGWSTIDGQIVAEGDWEPVLDKEKWEEVKALLTSRHRPYHPRVSSLTKLIVCGQCGVRLVTSGAKGIRQYRCPRRPNFDGCGGVTGTAEYIEDVVYAYTRERLADPRVRKRIAELRAEPTTAQAELANLELRVAELEKSLDEPGIPVETILRAIRSTKAKQAELLDTLAARNLEPLPVEDEWPDDLARRRALVDLVVKSITLMPATKASRGGFDPERVVIEGR